MSQNCKGGEWNAMKNLTKQERINKVNELIQVIATCGRMFFCTTKAKRISHFELAENGRLYFRDKYTNALLPMMRTNSRKWGTYFTEGGTLKSLIEYLADYIRTGKPITNQYVFGPWEEGMCNGDLWGYGHDMERIRQSALRLGVYSGEKQ